MKIFAKIPTYDQGSDGEINWNLVSEGYFNKFQIVGIEETYNEMNQKDETMFWNTNDEVYYCPLRLEQLLSLLGE